MLITQRILWAGLAPALLVFALAAPVAAAEPFDVVASDPILHPANWSTFGPSAGVIGRIQAAEADSANSLWLATARGLQHYDGLRFTTWTTADGLPSDEVTGITHTPDGTLWVSFLEHGVARFDGDHWVTYGLDDGLLSLRTRELFVTRSGDLWLGYGREADLGDPVHAVSRFEDDRWVNLALPDSHAAQVHRLVESASGDLWLTTDSGVLRHDGRGWTWFTESDGLPRANAYGLVEDREGQIWVCLFGTGVARFNGTSWRFYGEADGLDISRTPVSLLVADDGVLWSGGRKLLARFDGERWHSYDTAVYPGTSFVNLRGAPGQPGFWAFDWFTPTFFRFDPSVAAQTFSHPEGLSGGLETADGAVWFRTGQGLNAEPGPARAVRYHDGRWSAETAADGFLDGEVFSMTKTASGELWYVGTHGGRTAVARRVEDGWWLYTEGLVDPGSEPHPGGYVARPFLVDIEGELYLAGGVDGGAAFSHFDGDSWSVQVLDDGHLCETVSDMLQTSDGDLWAACWRPTGIEPDRGGALFRRRQGQWTRYTELDGLASTYITGLNEWPKGTLWVGHIEGISRLDLTAGEAVWSNDTDFDVPRPKPGDFLPGENDLWFAFMANRAAGAVRYDGQAWQRVTTQDGLINDDVTDIDRFADGSLWFTTRGGLSRFDGSRWLNYGRDHGIPGGTEAKLNPASDGTLWIDDSDGGIIRFRPGQGRGLPDTDLIEAPIDIDDTGNLRVSWSGVDPGNRTPHTNLQFEYRVDEGPWNQSTAMREVTLTSMRHGEHTLEVRSLDTDGNADPTPAVHTFTVAAPWWLNRWVIGGSALFLMLIALQTTRVVRRDRALHAANAELVGANVQLEAANREIQIADQRKSQFLASMSHELRTPMNAIIGFTRVVLRRSGEQLPERQRQNLEKVESSAEHLLGLINDLLDLSKIEAGRMEVRRTTFDVRPLIEGCCASVDPLVGQFVTLQSDVGSDVGTITSDEVKVRQIVVNLLSNALKFTDRGIVEVRVVRDGDAVAIAVSDTGVGIPADELDTIFEEFHQVGSAESEDRGTGLGLAITKRFAELLGGSIEVTSRVGEGSTFSVRLPAS